MKVILRNCKLQEDKKKRLWIPLNEFRKQGILDPGAPDLVEVETDEEGDPNYFFEVIGYSEKRDAFWVKEVRPEIEAENLDEEFEDYVKRMASD